MVLVGGATRMPSVRRLAAQLFGRLPTVHLNPDEVVTLGPGDTVLAPAGVKHGFVNRSGAKAALLASFPKTSFQRVAAD